MWCNSAFEIFFKILRSEIRQKVQNLCGDKMNKINLKQVVNSLTSVAEGAGISLKMDRERGKHEYVNNTVLSNVDSSLLSA